MSNSKGYANNSYVKVHNIMKRLIKTEEISVCKGHRSLSKEYVKYGHECNNVFQEWNKIPTQNSRPTY